MAGQTYNHRGRVWCANSNTVPSLDEQDGAFQCQECGRDDIKITKRGLVSHHMPPKAKP